MEGGDVLESSVRAENTHGTESRSVQKVASGRTRLLSVTAETQTWNSAQPLLFSKAELVPRQQHCCQWHVVLLLCSHSNQCFHVSSATYTFPRNVPSSTSTNASSPYWKSVCVCVCTGQAEGFWACIMGLLKWLLSWNLWDSCCLGSGSDCGPLSCPKKHVWPTSLCNYSVIQTENIRLISSRVSEWRFPVNVVPCCVCGSGAEAAVQIWYFGRHWSRCWILIPHVALYHRKSRAAFLSSFLEPNSSHVSWCHPTVCHYKERAKLNKDVSI